VSQVKGYWTETEDSSTGAYENVRDWVFDRYPLIPTQKRATLSLLTVTTQLV
jgi:hypothetical protein